MIVSKIVHSVNVFVSKSTFIIQQPKAEFPETPEQPGRREPRAEVQHPRRKVAQKGHDVATLAAAARVQPPDVALERAQRQDPAARQLCVAIQRKELFRRPVEQGAERRSGGDAPDLPGRQGAGQKAENC